MKKSLVTLFSILFLAMLMPSLQAQRTCNHAAHMHTLMQDHGYAAEHQNRQQKFNAVYQQNAGVERSAQCANPVTLPMAVHFQDLDPGYNEACLIALAEDQIRILNEDYGGYNADIATWNNSAAAFFPGVSNGETCIAFCLATQNHPAGFGLSNGDVAVTFNATDGTFDAAWPGYINIFVEPNLLTSTGNILLGSSPLGGSGNGDGVRINAAAFGSGAGCTGVVPMNNFDLGRTLTHELGHYLNLGHIWGNGCAVDDGIADTPEQASSYGGCPALGVQSCSTNDMHMNYMDYVNDACMYMFSADQSTVMEIYTNANLQDVISNYAPACLGITCTDGIQNGDETGVDCGGSNCDDCPTCTDGIQNGTETGVDCGGPNCVACPTCDDGIQNQDETDVDCGGSICAVCPTCTDGIQNGDEIGVDCGGSNCTACPAAPCTVFGTTYAWGSTPAACGIENGTNDPFGGIWGNEGYYIDNLLPNTDYNFNFCTGYDPANWTASITVYSANTDNTATVSYIGFAEGCSIDFTTNSTETSYFVYINDIATYCDAPQVQVVNGSGIIYCALPPLAGIFVDETATGNNDGTDWANAFTDLQDALAIGANMTIHIAEGIYLPTSGTGRGVAFDIPTGATLLGGYPSGGGTTTDPENNVTTLSGNIDGITGFAGNSYHVVRLLNVTNVILDGLDIKDGSADNASSFGRSRGGGIFSNGSTVSINNCTIRRNNAIFGGGIFATLSPNFTLISSTVKLNTAGNGSAIYHSNETAMGIYDSYIIDNNSTTRCAIEINNSSYTEIFNSVIANNASLNANAIGFIATNRDQSCNIYNSTILGETKNKKLITMQVGFNDVLDVNIYNTIIAHQNPNFSNNVVAFNNGTLNFNTSNCYIQGGSIIGTSTNNLYENIVGPITYGTNYAPESCSPSVNAGDNNLPLNNFDIDGNNRIVDVTIDIGAHEAQTSCGPVSKEFPEIKDTDMNIDISIFPNPTSGMVFLKTDLESFDVKVYDILGKVVAQSNTKEVDLSHLPLGIYVVNVENNGTIVKTEKMIKK